MNTLYETQLRFADYVLRDKGLDLAVAGIKDNQLTPQQCLSIYRNNTQLGLTEALRDGYPVVNKLVGNEFFNHLARSFIQRFPPKAGCLLSYGGNFADFIAQFQPAAGLPYLPDTARLEWLWHEAFHEAEANALEISTLATVKPEAYAKLGFKLHPSTRFLASDYPVLKIWQTNQDGYEGDGRINLDDGGCWLLLYRPGLEVELITLDEAEYLFLTLLAMQMSLNQAVEQVLMKNPNFAVQAVLQHWLTKGLLTEFYLKENSD